MEKVNESDSHICPYCGYRHEPWEGTSESNDSGKVTITCKVCGRDYYYQEKNHE